ncbi:MAG: SpoVG family protein [Thermoanaerobaculales bacterium]|nr:SpoVG family protein [Thermoanaerobaculales bacterium]
MQVTEVRISPAKGGKIRAFASIVIDDCFIINDLRVVEGRERQLFVTMPGRKGRNGQMRDIAHPLNSATREVIEQRVLDEYQTAVRHLAVPDPEAEKKSRDGQPGFMDRLSARLFNEDYWSSEANRRDLEPE